MRCRLQRNRSGKQQRHAGSPGSGDNRHRLWKSGITTHAQRCLSLDKILGASEFNNLRNFLRLAFWYEFHPCSTPCAFGSGLLYRFLRSSQSLLIENLALRQQLAVFKRHHSRPRLTPSDKVFWVLLRCFWSSWKTALVVTPETVVRWHRSGFQLYWRFISRVRKPVGDRRDPRSDLPNGGRESLCSAKSRCALTQQFLRANIHGAARR
jgi:hypothetical protein